MAAAQKDLHESLFDLIDTRLQNLSAGAPGVQSGQEAWTTEEYEAAVAELEHDKGVLVEHWRIQDGLVPASAPPDARACGQARPCPHVLGLATKYGLV